MRPSSIDKLDPALREEIARLRDRGVTIDAITAHLRQLGADVSRSAVGRHIQGLDQMMAIVREGREVALSVRRAVGEEPEGRGSLGNIAMTEALMTKLLIRSAAGDGAELDAKELLAVAKAIQSLTHAERSATDLALQIRKEIEAEQAKKLDGLAARGALDPAALARVRTELYGLA